MSKIRPFRDEPTLLDKLWVALAYLVLGGMVAQTIVYSDEGLHLFRGVGFDITIFIILGIILYITFFKPKRGKYFTRYHVMQALILNGAIDAFLMLLAALLNFMNHVPLFDVTAFYIAKGLGYPIVLIGPYAPTVLEFAIVALNAIMVFYECRGKYTELPYITEWVRSWV